MSRVNAKLANELAAKIIRIKVKTYPESLWYVYRDWLDTWTGSELDSFQLDLLTDMVVKRVDEAKPLLWSATNPEDPE